MGGCVDILFAVWGFILFAELHCTLICHKSEFILLAVHFILRDEQVFVMARCMRPLWASVCMNVLLIIILFLMRFVCVRRRNRSHLLFVETLLRSQNGKFALSISLRLPQKFRGRNEFKIARVLYFGFDSPVRWTAARDSSFAEINYPFG